MRKYRNYTNDNIIQYSKEVQSIAGLLRKLDLKPVGGNYASIQRKLQQLKVDCSHWTGQSWSKNKQLKDWSKYTRCVYLKKHLIKLRGLQCEDCRLTKWKCQDIKLEIHHIDGDRTNNEIVNLQLLCPNCHSYTNNFRKWNK